MGLCRRPLLFVCAAALIAGVLVAPASAVPEEVPDRLPLLSEPLSRGALIVGKAPNRTPSTKRIDGQIGDWKGKPSGIGGTARLDRGEHIYTDYLFDDFGADDGDDAVRLAVLTPLRQAEARTARLDQLFQAAGDQFDAPRPIGAPDHYGDKERSGATDLREVRWAAIGDRVQLLARTTSLTDKSLAVLVLADTAADDGALRQGVFGGLVTARYDTELLITADGVDVADTASGKARSLPDAAVKINPAGWTNALEASFPAALLGPRPKLTVISGRLVDGGFVPANVAYRFDEPVAGVYNDQAQALALRANNVDAFATKVDFAQLAKGASQTARPGPGYAERQMRSGANISREDGENGIWQPYGLYVPTTYDPAKKTPLTFWLHYRGGKAHSGGAWTPRLINELGEEQGNIVVTPRARGTSTWYVSEAHQDFFEVFADVHKLLNVDPDRRYVSGYSMGGYGTYLFGLLYPDLFAAGYSTSGAMTQGMWTGEGPDDCASGQCFVEANEGDADAQLTYRILDNARHFPIAINHGTDDELVPVTGVQRIGARLAELGYRYDLTTFFGYEHYSQAIIDEWADAAEYINGFTRDRDPRDVTYRVVPALVNAVNTVTAGLVKFHFNPDGAYWVDGLKVRDGDLTDPAVSGLVNVTSFAQTAPSTVTVPRAGVFSPLGHSTPFARHGLDWMVSPLGGNLSESNGFSAKLTNLSQATFDTARMGLKPATDISGSVTVDGPTALTLTKVGRTVDVLVDGTKATTARGTITIDLVSGAHTIVLKPVS
jgi:poly(3-hydroxybutyrate) depolymerase